MSMPARTAPSWALLWLTASLAFAADFALAATKPLAIKSAAFNVKRQELTIKTQVAVPGGPLSLLHGDGGILWQGNVAPGLLVATLPKNQLGQVPCAVEAQLGESSVRKSVAGAPARCKRIPVCKIIEPTNGSQIGVNTPFTFRGKVTVRNPKAKKLSYEWDFGGGAMGVPMGDALTGSTLRPVTLSGTTRFVRDNSTYRIRFAAIDSEKNRCEAAVEVSVGTPPDGLPAKVAESAQPDRGSAMTDEQHFVVMPFQEWTMQHFSDMRVQPNGYISFDPIKNNLNSYVFEKGSVGNDKPKFIGSDRVSLRYSAASNPMDPVGANSINSTSQNWPLNTDPAKPAKLMSATVQKSDWWEEDIRSPTDTFCKCYDSEPWIQFFGAELWMAALPGLPKPDEGYFPHVDLSPEPWLTAADWAPYIPDITDPSLQTDYYGYYRDSLEKQLALEPPGSTHGRYMPGVDHPYSDNVPQAFPKFDAERQWFSSPLMPITDIDDQGRVNPYPLLRIEAVDSGTQTTLAKTDGVLSNSRDFHCRECHAKGQIGANENAGYTKDTFHSSPAGMNDTHSHGTVPPVHLDKPAFFSVEDIQGDPGNLFDQEYAAALNYSSLHQFYDGMGFLDHMQKGGINDITGLIGNDWPAPCFGCHLSGLQAATTNADWWSAESYDYTAKSYDPNYSIAMHRFHAELQWNPTKTDIVRDSKGMYQRFDWKDKPRQATKNINPDTLFPIFDKDTGEQLPMEQNCLKCHAGHREPMYNDRMKTAGVTCFDCHGDMLAVGQAFPKDPAKSGSNDHHDYRIPWFDETDCGSCHIGTGNVGKDAKDGFFSAGAKRRAFEDTDPAAISRPVNKADPDAVRFAVVPNYVGEFVMSATRVEPSGTGADENGVITDPTAVQVDAPIYRFGKDQHGDVACAACHGAAHAVGPNRDPKSNENLTAIQLQGYPGQIYECNVCHTSNAFSTEDSIGSTLHYPDKDGNPTILAGPHNTHPINDPNWYLNERTGDAAQSNQTDGTKRGGWHSAWSGKPGLNGEDQCAACHGKDHLGTRLSKTPVDRVFDFSGFEFSNLKKNAGFKSKVVRVKAGTPIGCNTCHDVPTSQLKSPPGPVTPRHAPVIAATPEPAFVIGQNFAYTVSASDEDGGNLTYKLLKSPTGMTISDQGQVAWDHAPADPSAAVSFLVEVADDTGLTVTRWFGTRAVCPDANPNWDAGLGTGQCTAMKITSARTVGVDATGTFQYQATSQPVAAHYQIAPLPDGSPLPNGFTMTDAGAIDWPTDANSPTTISFRITASDAQNTPVATLDITLNVCQLPQHWDGTMKMCM